MPNPMCTFERLVLIAPVQVCQCQGTLCCTAALVTELRPSVQHAECAVETVETLWLFAVLPARHASGRQGSPRPKFRGGAPVLGLDQGDAAKLGAGAGDEASAEGACLDLVHLEDSLLPHLIQAILGDVGEQDVLLHRQPQAAVPIPLRSRAQTARCADTRMSGSGIHVTLDIGPTKYHWHVITKQTETSVAKLIVYPQRTL